MGRGQNRVISRLAIVFGLRMLLYSSHFLFRQNRFSSTADITIKDTKVQGAAAAGGAKFVVDRPKEEEDEAEAH